VRKEGLDKHHGWLFDFNLQGGKSQWNCLHIAVQQNNIKLLMLLLETTQLEESLDF
jgi:hypothetical protein